MICTEWCIVNHQEDSLHAITLYCRSWQCEVCAPKRKRQLIARGKAGNPNTFITLTVNPTVGADPAERAARLADAWRVIRRRAIRKYGYADIPFLAVFERTKAGEPHLHILARCRWLDQRWLSDQMRDLMAAPVVDIRRVHGRRAAMNYVTKYLGKDPHRFGTTKRYWASRSYNTEEPPDWVGSEGFGAGWTVFEQTLPSFVRQWTARGWSAVRWRDGWFLSKRAREGGSVSPPRPPWQEPKAGASAP